MLTGSLNSSTREEATAIERLKEGVATIAATFYPKPVIVRFSDFKSNEYANLLGGSEFEPIEENPMLGFRGTARYISAQFKPCFALEVQAINPDALLSTWLHLERPGIV